MPFIVRILPWLRAGGDARRHLAAGMPAPVPNWGKHYQALPQ
jgi:hypothetical protein